ncbi:MAG: helix-turn-helix domain-containing protein [Eubacteriaceae bacterium]|nr:helix-turn-helix domain-containing protein [Eubacteriaceae bacterium]
MKQASQVKVDIFAELEAYPEFCEACSLSSPARHVWIALLALWNRSWWAPEFTVAASELAKRAVVSRTSAWQALKELEECGAIVLGPSSKGRVKAVQMQSLNAIMLQKAAYSEPAATPAPDAKPKAEKAKPEPAKEAAEKLGSESLLWLPLAGGESYIVSDEYIAELQEAYPGLDVASELRQMRAWCDANPAKRKMPSKIKSFIVGWLNRSLKGEPGYARANGPAGSSREAPDWASNYESFRQHRRLRN